jgi:small subunit ribosomal protein S5
MGYYRQRRQEPEDTKFKSEVLYVNRVAKVLKGGRRFRFTALVVVGDGEGSVGLGLGKAPEVVEAIRKGEELARKHMVSITRRGTTIPYEIKHKYCTTTVVLRPAREGAGITAGGPARPLLALAGVSDCTAKFIGSNNRVNCAKATFEALLTIVAPETVVKHRRDRGYRIEVGGKKAAAVPAEDKEKATTAHEAPAVKAAPPAPAGDPPAAKAEPAKAAPAPEHPVDAGDSEEES